MKNKFFPALISSVIAITTLTTMMARAQVSCPQVHFDANHRMQYTLNRVEQVIRDNKKDIPAFYKIVGDRKIPVMLLTKSSAKALDGLIDQTISHGVMLMYDANDPNPTDHGIFRVGKYMADLDSPSMRGYGEMNENGLSWKQVRPYLERRIRDEDSGKNINFERFEILFQVTAEQEQAALVYHLARRATVFRVPWTFHGPDHVQEGKPNLLKGCGEHCYIFSTGSGVSSQVYQIRAEIQKMGIADVDAYLQQPEIKTYLTAARERLLQTAYNAPEMKWDIVNGDEFLAMTNKVMPAGFSVEQKRTLLNWLLALHSSEAYLNVQKSLGLNGGWGLAEIKNPNVIGVIVWAKGDRAKAFNDATFESPGVQTTWTKDNQIPFQ